MTNSVRSEPSVSLYSWQSSPAMHAAAHGCHVVKVPGTVPAEFAGTLDCGVQTGAG